MHRISRKMAIIGAAGVLTLAGVAGIAGHNVVHASTSTVVAHTTATDTDTLQQGDQTGNQADTGEVDKPDAATEVDKTDTGANEPAATGADAPNGPDTGNTQSGSQTDTP